MAYTAPNPLPYRSDLGTSANLSFRPNRKYPLPTECPRRLEGYAFDQSFDIFYSSFPPAALNTQSSAAAFGLSDANAILTDYGQPASIGGGMVSSLATFYRVPAAWDNFSNSILLAYPSFPGQLGGQYTRFTQAVNTPVRIRYDYFVVDPDGVLTGAGVLDSGGSAITLVTSASAIPRIAESVFKTVYSGAAVAGTRTNDLIKNGGDNIGGTTYLETLPNREFYLKWIANAAASGWSSTAWDGASGVGYTTGTASSIGQFVVQDSVIQPYAGNILCRMTTYVLAK